MPRTPSDAARRIGDAISAERQRRGWTQDQLAVASEIDSSNIRAYESGRSMLSVPTLVRIAHALEVPPGTLLAEVTIDLLAPTKPRRAAAGG